MTHWVSDFLKNFHGICDAYVAGPSDSSALPPPLAPATPKHTCNRAPSTGTIATAHPVGTATHGTQRTQWVPVPGAKWARKPRTQWVPGINRETGEIPQKPGQPRTQWAKTGRLRPIVTMCPFAQARRKILNISTGSFNLRIPKPHPSDKRASCHQCSKCIPNGCFYVQCAKTGQEALRAVLSLQAHTPSEEVIHTASYTYPLGQLLYKTTTCG